MAKDTNEDRSLKLGNSWSEVFIGELILIVIINVFTLIAFARNSHLRKHTTYLIINLTVADLLVGAVTGPQEAFGQDLKLGHGFSWQGFSVLTSGLIFPLASQANLSLISLERLHATLYPFRHCLIDKWLYFKVIIGSWMITLLVACTMAVLEMLILATIPYTFLCYTCLTLFIITVSSVVITTKVKKNPLLHDFNAVASERKLSVTLSIVTVVSILTILPTSVWGLISQYILNYMSGAAFNQMNKTVVLLYYANSIVNPLIYAIRMQEFRKAFKVLSCQTTTATRDVQPTELHTM